MSAHSVIFSQEGFCDKKLVILKGSNLNQVFNVCCRHFSLRAAVFENLHDKFHIMPKVK